MPFAFSINSAFPLIGSFLGGAIVPSAYNRGAELDAEFNKDRDPKDYEYGKAFGEAFRAGFIFGIVCFGILLCIYFLDWRMEKVDEKKLLDYKAKKKYSSS